MAITRLYRVLFYPDATTPKKHGQLASATLPAQQQGGVHRDQTQVLVRYLRELGKVRTADDRGIAPAYLRQKAWPANASRITSLRLRKECATRIGLPMLLDINHLKEAIRDGIRAGTWLYYDPKQKCAYSKESPTSPLVEISGDIELVLPDEAEGIPICGKPTPNGVNCPVCDKPQDNCICGIATKPTTLIEAEGAPAQVFQAVADKARDSGITALRDLQLNLTGSGPDFSRDLEAIPLAVPQFPKAEITVDVEASFDLPDSAHLRVAYRGPWKRYREIGNTTNRTTKNALRSSGRLSLRLVFPQAVEPDGSQLGTIRDALERLNAGRVSVTATPTPDES